MMETPGKSDRCSPAAGFEDVSAARFRWRSEVSGEASDVDDADAGKPPPPPPPGDCAPWPWMNCGRTPVPINWASSSWLMHLRISSHDWPAASIRKEMNHWNTKVKGGRCYRPK